MPRKHIEESVRIVWDFWEFSPGTGTGTAPLSAFRQFESASVLGYVKGSSGAAIPNTTVTLTNTKTNIAQSAKTDSEGRYEFASVPIGEYKVTAEAGGFERALTPELYGDYECLPACGCDLEVWVRSGHGNGDGGAEAA